MCYIHPLHTFIYVKIIFNSAHAIIILYFIFDHFYFDDDDDDDDNDNSCADAMTTTKH